MDKETKEWIEKQIKEQDELQKGLNELNLWLEVAKKEFPDAKILYKLKNKEEWTRHK